MATDAQRARRRAQRATAARVRNRQRILPKAITAPSRRAQEAYVRRVLNGEEPYPAKGTAEAHQLARWGSYARWNQADPAYFAAFEQYFYHDEKRPDTAVEDEEEYDDGEDEEEE
jgi:hypothetical protein